MNQSVWRYLERDDFERLADFACYMMGSERSDFVRLCRLSRSSDPAAFAACWRVYDQWQDWLEDFSREHNS